MPRPALLVACLAPPLLLAACGRDKSRSPRVPPRAAVALVAVADDARPGGPSTALLQGPSLGATAAAWTPDLHFRRWTAPVPDAPAWVAAWPGPGSASLTPRNELAVDLRTPDPEFPALAPAIVRADGGRWKRPMPAPGGLRVFQAGAAGDPTLHVSLRGESPSAEKEFEQGQLSRLDFIPSDRAPALRSRPEFRTRDLAETLALQIRIADPARRAAVVAALDPVALCRRALFDPSRAVRRLAPAALHLPDLPSPRPLPPPAPLTRLTLSSDPGRDAALLAAAVRGALREKGIAVAVPEPGEEADLHLLHLVAGSSAPGAFFQPLRSASELVEPIAPILRSLEDAQSQEERAAWYAAWEAALLERSLVLPLARGVCHSLERADSPVTIDPFGRYLPKTPAPATAR